VNDICGHRTFLTVVRSETGVLYHNALQGVRLPRLPFVAKTYYGRALPAEVYENGPSLALGGACVRHRHSKFPRECPGANEGPHVPPHMGFLRRDVFKWPRRQPRAVLKDDTERLSANNVRGACGARRYPADST
jgi:hypothetical protein